nr:hypothetical protein [Candidatus Palauibacterales bacterium]
MRINGRVPKGLSLGLVVALAGVVATACGDDEEVPTSGGLAVTTVTTGSNPDADGYAVTVDGTGVGSVDV